MTEIILISVSVVVGVLFLTEVLFKAQLIAFKKRAQLTEKLINKKKYRASSKLTDEQKAQFKAAAKSIRELKKNK